MIDLLDFLELQIKPSLITTCKRLVGRLVRSARHSSKLGKIRVKSFWTLDQACKIADDVGDKEGSKCASTVDANFGESASWRAVGGIAADALAEVSVLDQSEGAKRMAPLVESRIC